MLWRRGTSDADIEDQRGSTGGSQGRFPGGGGGLRLGLGGIVILGILSVVFKTNLFTLLDQVPSDTSVSTSTPTSPPGSTSAEENDRVEFVKFVLNDTQDTWTKLLPAQGRQYERAKLVLFRDAIDSACGFAKSASGPFYCPGDRKVYIDVGFFDDLKQRFGAAGEFAQAYVIAHEIGHHVQQLVGVESEVRRARQSRPDLANDLSVRLELQADCYAGVWGHSTAQRNLLEKGDIEAGLNAAAAIGDDRIQKMSGGRVFPERFTHGSSAQRVTWFRRGLDAGQVSACDTFAGRQ